MADLIVDTTRTGDIQKVPTHRPSDSHETISVIEELQKQVQNLTLMAESFASLANKPGNKHVRVTTVATRPSSRD